MNITVYGDSILKGVLLENGKYVVNHSWEEQLARDYDLQIRNQDGKMFIMVETGVDISLEKGLFSNRADFFEEVFGIRPVIKQKKR